MGTKGLTRRTVLSAAALMPPALTPPFARRAAASAAPGGGMVLGWHTNIAPRWLDPLQAKWQDVFPTFVSAGYAYPWEDIELKA